MKAVFQVCITIMVLTALTSTTFASATYSTGFENAEGFIAGQTLFGQGGWSGGEAWTGDAFNKNKATEGIVTGIAHSGTQCWYFPGGPTTEGAGTPFGPSLSNAVDQDGESMTLSLWFKAVSAGDGSTLKIETGTPAGNDRGAILAYVRNTPTGIDLWGYASDGAGGYMLQDLFYGVSATEWHQLTWTLTKSGYEDTVSLSLDGSTPVVWTEYMNAYYRYESGYDYGAHSRIRIRENRDSDAGALGFYFDDISYTSTPEPASLSIIALGGLLTLRRNR